MKQLIINKSMKTKNVMDKIKLASKIFILLFISVSYSQQGYYVEKDSRIKKYQKEIIQYLIDNKSLNKKEKGEIIISNYSGSIGITKFIEVFPLEPNKTKVLLVRFYSLATHSLNYWGLLDINNKFLFYYDENHKTEISDYLKKYDENTRNIILSSLKIYYDWDNVE